MRCQRSDGRNKDSGKNTVVKTWTANAFPWRQTDADNTNQS